MTQNTNESWMNELGDDYLEVKESGGASVNRISTKGKCFALKFIPGEDGANRPMQAVGPELNVVILGITPDTTRAYYEGVYNETDNYIPKCSSNNGIAPVKRSSSPQSLLCANCPKAAVGSAMSLQGKPVSACRVGRNMVVAVNGKTDELFAMKVNGQSLTPLKKYLAELKQFGMKYPFVNTRMSFQMMGKNNQILSYPIVNFTRLDNVTKSVGMAAIELIKNGKVREMLGLDEEVVTSLAAPAQSAFNAPGVNMDESNSPYTEVEADPSFDYGASAPAKVTPVAAQYAPPKAQAVAIPPSEPVAAKARTKAKAPEVSTSDIDAAINQFSSAEIPDDFNLDDIE